MAYTHEGRQVFYFDLESIFLTIALICLCAWDARRKRAQIIHLKLEKKKSQFAVNNQSGMATTMMDLTKRDMLGDMSARSFTNIGDGTVAGDGPIIDGAGWTDQDYDNLKA